MFVKGRALPHPQRWTLRPDRGGRRAQSCAILLKNAPELLKKLWFWHGLLEGELEVIDLS